VRFLPVALSAKQPSRGHKNIRVIVLLVSMVTEQSCCPTTPETNVHQSHIQDVEAPPFVAVRGCILLAVRDSGVE
jgi:hypothetical protein